MLKHFLIACDVKVTNYGATVKSKGNDFQVFEDFVEFTAHRVDPVQIYPLYSVSKSLNSLHVIHC